MEFKKTKNSQRIILSLKTRTPVHLKFLLIFTLLITTFSYSLNAQAWERLIARDASKYDYGTIIPEDCNNTDVNQSNYSNYTITLPPQSNTGPFTFTVPLYGSLTAGEFQDMTLTDFNGGIPEPTPSGINVTFVNPTPNFGQDYITFTVKVTRNSGPDIGNWDEQKYQFKNSRKDIKLIFVLDNSGSMSLKVYSSAETRWNTLKNSVASFLSKYEDEGYFQPGDSFGISYFSTNVTNPNFPAGAEQNHVIGYWNTISGETRSASSLVIDDMNSKGPTNMTAVGKGLRSGKTKVNSETDPSKTRRVVFLFTDGLQNQNPLVNDDGQSIGVSPDISYLNDISYPITECNDDIIRYYVVSTLPTGDPIDYLTNIGIKNCGAEQSVTMEDFEGLTTFFDNFFTTVLDGSSPQLIVPDETKLVDGNAEITFKVNNYISNILFELNYKPGEQFEILSIEKDGIPLTDKFKNKDLRSSNFLMRSLDLPVKHEKDFINSKGTWKIKVSGESENPVNLICFVDDHLFSYDCVTDQSSYTVGDTIHFNTVLKIGNNVLVNESDKVSVLLLKPGDDIGHLLATYATPDFNADTTDKATPAEQKFMDLMYNDSAFYNALIANKYVVELTADEHGIFTGEYLNTDLTGVYQARFMINASDEDMGHLIRSKIMSLRFKFGQLDNNKTDYNVDLTQGDDGQTAVITVRPKNKFGYYMGPGYINKIKLNIDPKQGVIKDKKDNLDGSYTFTIVNIPSTVNPQDFQITVFNEIFKPCYPVTIWYYVILIIIILILIILYVKKHKKSYKILLWLLLIIWIAYIILRFLGYICYEFL